MWVVGRHPVEELMASRAQRPRSILFSDAVSADARKALAEAARSAGIPCATCSRPEWSRRTGEREGGVAAELGEYRYAAYEDWVDALPDKAAALLLDGVTDPQNLGAILRSARAFGIAGVVIPRDNSCPVTPAVFKASAGGAAHVPVIQVTNLARTVAAMKDAGFWTYAADGNGETEIGEFAPPARTAVVLGGEEKGIRRLVRETCDGSIRIAMRPGVDSLNVGVAAGIIAFRLRSLG